MQGMNPIDPKGRNDMKKFVIILLAVCLLLGGLVGYLVGRDGSGSAAEPAAAGDAPSAAAADETPTAEALPSAEPVAVRTLDYETIRALHAPDEIVGSVDGRDVSWDEFFYWLHDVGLQAEQYVQTLAMYGQSLDWTDKLSDESEQTLAEYVVELAQTSAVQLCTVEAVAEENGVSLTPENEAALAEELRRTIESSCGEGATEEDFNARLEAEHVSRAMYDRISRANYLFQNCFNALYGENGAKVDEETALAFLRDNSYLGAAHILFATIDLDTYEPLDEETIAQKLQQAEAVSAELRAIEDVDERTARFAELKAQYCEDSGKESFPDGYLFTPGAMVSEFEDGVKALEEYEVSEPVLSTFGYHVIMRLPLSAEMTVDYSSAGTPLTARALCANESFNAMMSSRIESGVFTPAEGFSLDLTQYLQ